MLDVSPAMVDWLERFAARQQPSDEGGLVLRLAAEKEGCGLLEYALYIDARQPGDRLTHLRRVTLAVDADTAELLDRAWLDLDADGAPELVPARKLAAGCPAGSADGCTAGHGCSSSAPEEQTVPRTPFALPEDTRTAEPPTGLAFVDARRSV